MVRLSYNPFFRRILFPLVDTANRTTIRHKLDFLLESQWWPKEKLLEYQNKKLRLLVEHAYANVPYYRRLFENNNIKPEDVKTVDDLEKIPLLTKGIVRENYSDLIARNHGRMTLYQTAGSTGEPARFYVDKEADSWKWACELRGWGWAGYQIGEKHALLSGNPKRGVKRLKDILMRCAYLQTNSMNDKTLEKYLHRIKRGNIKFVAGYASALYLLAKKASEDGVPLDLNGVVTFGETLLPTQRESIEKTFNCGVNDTYGLGGEALLVADQCEKRGLYHTNMENVITGVVDGQIVLTGLNNYAMPVIRYTTGDIAYETKTKCTCGRNLTCLGGVAGRINEVITTPRGYKLLVQSFLPIMFKKITSVRQFQVIQNQIDEITIKLVTINGFNAKETEVIKKEISKACDNDLRINFEFVDDIPATRTGKRNIIVSNVSSGGD